MQNKVERKYDYIKEYLKSCSILVNNEKDGESLINFIKNQTKVDMEFFLSKDNIPQSNNIIELINEKNAYKFELLEREGNVVFSNQKTEDITDLFNIQYIRYFLKLNDSKIQNRYFKYYYKFLEIQSLLAKYLIFQKTNSLPEKDLKISNGFNSYPSFSDYNFQCGDMKIIEYIFSFLISLEFSMFSYFLNLRIIEEKEKKLTFLLERKGIKEKQYCLSWFISYIILIIIPVVISFIFLGLLFYYKYFLIHIFCQFILFSLNMFAQFYLFYISISSIQIASTLIKINNFGSCFLGIYLLVSNTNEAIKIIFSFIPQINVIYCTYCIFQLQTFHFSWEKIFLKANKITFFWGMIIYVASIFLHIIFIFLIKWLKKSRYKLLCSFSNKDINEEGFHSEANTHIIHEILNNKNKENKEKNKYLNINLINKSYKSNKKVIKIINGFNLELFPDEIFCLLGGNGAGKTTLIKIICGIKKPDSGNIIYEGGNLHENIGYCPQENILFEHLTVEEHLKYFCEIREKVIEQEKIENLINEFGLKDKRNCLCGTLSGGQKRMLSIALALLGDPKIILLDEPTNSLDIYSRRKVWNYLKDNKEGKIILVTTHSLNEVEFLGDRIGIMSNGGLKCSGTIPYLKTQYKVGVNLNIYTNLNNFENEKIQKIPHEISYYKREISINFDPEEIKDKNDILELFEYIEKVIGNDNYSLNSSLERIFMENIKEKENKNKIQDNLKNNDNDNDNLNDKKNLLYNNYENKYNKISFLSQICSSLQRNLLSLWRSICIFLLELVSSLLICYLFFIIVFQAFPIDIEITELNLIEILESNKNYIYEFKEGYLKNSNVYENSFFITLKPIEKKPNTIYEFINNVYDNSCANIAKGSIFIDQIQENNKTIFKVYNTEINSNFGYLLSNIMFIVSSFLKNEYNIEASIFPVIKNEKDSTSFTYTDFLELHTLLIITFFFEFGYILFLGKFANEKIKEKNLKIKHLLYLSGNNKFCYYIGFFIVDFLKLLIFTGLLIIIICLLGIPILYILLNMLVTNLSSLIFLYFIILFCSKEDSGSKFLFYFFISFFSFFIIMQALYIYEIQLGTFLFENFFEDYTLTFFVITPITSMILSFTCLIASSINIRNNINKTNNKDELIPSTKDYFLTSLIYQAINITIYSLLIITFESGCIKLCLHRLKNKLFLNVKNNIEIEMSINNHSPRDSFLNNSDNNDLGPILNNEDNKSRSSSSSSPAFFNEKLLTEHAGGLTTNIKGLQKTYWFCCRKNVTCLNNFYLHLDPKESFGLLGYNGAGKTSLFKAITKEILFDKGSIHIFGNDINKEFNKIRAITGYCPQTDPIFDYMKVKEVIKYYLKLKNNDETVESICEKFKLSDCKDKYCKYLSGGNKRKLSLAIALMNKPHLLLLDEPLTGVDIKSKREIMKNIIEYSKKGPNEFNMILATHSIEEAEILCNRISWFENGNFANFDIENLKQNNFSKYNLHIKFKDSNNNNNQIQLKNESFKIEGFDKFKESILSHQEIHYYVNLLIDFINQIEQYSLKIKLIEVKVFYSSFKIEVILKEKIKKYFFIELMNIKNKNNEISELIITTESIENIIVSKK